MALAVQTGSAYKAKADDVLLKEAIDVVKQVLGIEPELIYHEQGVAEFSLDQLLAKLSAADYYESFSKVEAKSYRTFSVYPASSRDVAMWVDQEGRQDQIENLLKAEAGPLCVRITHLDTFSKEGRVSYAFRLVFQAQDHTLTDLELEPIMEKVYQAIAAQGWEAR